MTRAHGARAGSIIAAALCAAVAFALPARAAAGEKITIPATSGTPAMPAYVARPPRSAAAPAVLVLHGCEGYRKRYGKIADGLARHGYVAVAIDTLTPRGLRNACSDLSGSRTEAAYARAALNWMRAQPYVDANRLALVGYSMGAIASLDLVDPWHAAAAPAGLQAAVAYYPSCRNRVAANVNAPLQILDGDADDWTPAPPCHALVDSAQAAGKPTSITIYPGATHAFNVNAPDRISGGHHLRYDPAASSDARARTFAFLHRYLAESP
jgi:dienelactone hydrolase